MSSVYKLRIHAWAETAQLGLETVKMAQMVAVYAEPVFQLLTWLRDGEVDKHLPRRPEPDIWLSFYEDHRALRGAVADLFPQEFGGSSQVEQLLGAGRMVSSWAVNDPKGFRGWLKQVFGTPAAIKRHFSKNYRQARRDYKKHLEEMRRMMGPPRASKDDGFGEMLGTNHAIHFYFRIFLPCMALYGKTPLMLLRQIRLRKATQAEAVEQLMRLDDMAEYRPEVERWRNGVGGEERKNRLHQIKYWQSRGTRDGQFSERRVKQMMGGLIAALAEGGKCYRWGEFKVLPHKVSAEDIFQLFEAVAEDKANLNPAVAEQVAEGADLDVDQDLDGMSMAVWRREVARYKRQWRPLMPKPPKKIDDYRPPGTEETHQN